MCARLAVLGMVTSGLVLGGGPARAAQEPKVPILGQGLSSSDTATKTDVSKGLVTLHGVRRAEGATVVYWSLGWTPDTTDSENAYLVGTWGYNAGLAWHSEVHQLGDVAVIDSRAMKAYTPIIGPDDTCKCSDSSYALPADPKPGKAYVMHAVLPELPEGIDEATVKVAGKVFTDVPVEDGLMTPAKPKDEPILVGTGWPKVNPAGIDKVKDQDRFIYPVSENSKVLDSAVATREEGAQTQIDIAADVLFTFDKDTLTGKAKQEIKTAADQIRKAKPKAAITITGHTDSDGAKDYNQDLSERRAQSVAKEIKPLLPKGVEVTTEGKGESEPIASNETDTGKAKNRRVTITVPGGEQ